MGQAGGTARSADTAWDHRPWFLIPSWLLSLVLHALILFAFAANFQRPEVIGPRIEEERVVGIYTRESDASPDVSPGDAAEQSDAPQTEQFTPAPDTPTDFPIDDSPPVPLSLPTVATSRIGPGPTISAPTSASIQPVIRRPPATGGSAVATAGAGQPRIPFFGATATGSRFAYVIDASGSMTSHHAMDVAKAELVASLEKLDSAQQFQIIFYTIKPHPMSLRGSQQMYFATDTNRSLARQFIRSVQPDSGTNHIDALLLALSLKPEAIFFLTDAEEPRLTAGELENIRQRNGGRCQIHSIQFGTGADLNLDNFLKKLARQNNGTFRYLDVTRFERP